MSCFETVPVFPLNLDLPILEEFPSSRNCVNAFPRHGLIMEYRLNHQEQKFGIAVPYFPPFLHAFSSRLIRLFAIQGLGIFVNGLDDSVAIRGPSRMIAP